MPRASANRVCLHAQLASPIPLAHSSGVALCACAPRRLLARLALVGALPGRQLPLHTHAIDEPRELPVTEAAVVRDVELLRDLTDLVVVKEEADAPEPCLELSGGDAPAAVGVEGEEELVERQAECLPSVCLCVVRASGTRSMW